MCCPGLCLCSACGPRRHLGPGVKMATRLGASQTQEERIWGLRNARSNTEGDRECEERRTGRRSVLRATRILVALSRGSHSNCLASAGCIFEEEPGSLYSAVSHSLSGFTRLALHCKLSNLPPIYNACPSPLPGSENRHCLGCFDIEICVHSPLTCHVPTPDPFPCI